MAGFAEEDLQACDELPDHAAQLSAAAREGLRQGVAAAVRELQVRGGAEGPRRLEGSMGSSLLAKGSAGNSSSSPFILPLPVLLVFQIYYAEPPTVDLGSIACPTHIWQGGRDATTPPGAPG